MLWWPPLPFGKRIGEYETALRTRYGGTVSETPVNLLEAKQRIEAVAQGVPDVQGMNAEEVKAQLGASKELLTQVSNAVDSAAVILAKHEEDVCERAAAFVRSSLDMQVGKSSGLLAFNALVIAAATILWTNAQWVPPYIWLPPLLFWTLLVSSVLSLASVPAIWGSPEDYKTAGQELKRLLMLAAARAWLMNIAAIGAVLSVVLIAVWIGTTHQSRGEVALPDGVHQPVVQTGTNVQSRGAETKVIQRPNSR